MVTSTRRSPAAREAARDDAPPRPPLPWLDDALAQALATQRAHALLVHGPEGVGQLDFALGLAKAWLCETPAGERDRGLACGRCAGCHLVDERTHPDLRLVVPEAMRAEAGLPGDDAGSDEDGKKRKPSREIKVDQIRTALEFAELTSGRASHKVLVIHPAEAINPIAANALLKTLEEPGALRFVLASGAAQALLPTIRSRCQAVRLQMPPREAALAWLAAQG
ncbi:MAG TPA: DNA polymerase III subunit delta', partial [Burkholderiaceae bacterium]|nr:DNA polymerase III subunit delta' [Burkholderiaceae bacterium]